MNDATVLDLTETIVAATIKIRKNHKTKLPDAIIAATALVHGVTIITCNTKDFQLIDGLVCINPHDL